MDDPSPKVGRGLAGAGAAACAACCAGPIVSFVAGASVASLLGALVFGALGLAMVIALGVVAWRRGRRRRCSPAHAVPVSAPALKVGGRTPYSTTDR